MPSLKDHAAELRARLKDGPSWAQVERLRLKLKLKHEDAAILAWLHQAGMAWVSAEVLSRALPLPAEGATDLGAVLKGLDALRDQLGEDVVLSYLGRGYTLGAPGVLAVRRALADE